MPLRCDYFDAFYGTVNSNYKKARPDYSGRVSSPGENL